MINVMGKGNNKERTFCFSLEIIRYLKLLPQDYVNQTIGKQLLRSATSIGANVIEAQAGSSRKDFSNYYQIALKSANETKYWLELLIDLVEGEARKKRYFLKKKLR